MRKIAVVFWSGTGNTEDMAKAVLAGAQSAGAEVTLFQAADFDAANMDEFQAVAFGCPSMGDEQLEEGEFEPMFTACIPKLSGKPIALFGSYGWGDGEWMREWVERMKSAGATVVNGEGLMCNEAPDDEAILACEALGAQLASL